MSNDFPLSWKKMSLEDCMSIIIDYRGKTPRKVPFGVPLITAKIIKHGRIGTVEEYIATEDYDSWMSRGLPQAGDVVMTTEGPLGEIAQLDGSKVVPGQRVITLRGSPALLNNTFLKFQMMSSYVQQQLRARATGTTVQGIRQSELRKISLTIPPLPEQQAIAHILGSLDDKIELNRQMNETLEGIARALFKSWFVDFDPVRAKMEGRQPYGMDAETAALFPDGFEDSALGEIPRGWKITTIGEAAHIVGGSTPSTKEPIYWDEGTIPWATPKDLSSLTNAVLMETERCITEAGLQQISSGLLPRGTVLLSSRAPIGYLAITEIPVAINQGFIALVCKKELSNYYILQWLYTNMDTIEGRANGTTFLEISKANFRPIPLIVPSSSILKTFSQQISSIHNQVVNNLQQNQTLTTLRDTLLPKLLSGELRVGQAEKEVGAML